MPLDPRAGFKPPVAAGVLDRLCQNTVGIRQPAGSQKRGPETGQERYARRIGRLHERFRLLEQTRSGRRIATQQRGASRDCEPLRRCGGQSSLARADGPELG